MRILLQPGRKTPNVIDVMAGQANDLRLGRDSTVANAAVLGPLIIPLLHQINHLQSQGFVLTLHILRQPHDQFVHLEVFLLLEFQSDFLLLGLFFKGGNGLLFFEGCAEAYVLLEKECGVKELALGAFR